MQIDPGGNQKHHKIEQEKLYLMVKDQTSLIGAKWQPEYQMQVCKL